MVEHMHHPLFRVTSLLKFKMGGKIFNATGFFANIDGYDFLITNRHVFEHELGINSEELHFHFLPHEGVPETEMNVVHLEEGDWLTHRDSEVDVAALPLEDFDLDDTGNLAIPEKNFVGPLTELILSGNSAIVVGYPEAGWFSRNKSPIIRNALISSIFGSKYNGDDCFVMDAKMHPGMSGSPVFTAPSAILHNVKGRALRFTYKDLDEVPALIGIHSGPVKQDNDLDLHRVWYTTLISEIVDSYISD